MIKSNQPIKNLIIKSLNIIFMQIRPIFYV